MPGYRVQLPQKVHPISAGIKGGLVGGLVLPIPALIYGLVSGHGIWYPVNLLAGMALPNIGQMNEAELAKFHLLYLSVGLCIHLATSLVAGLAYGVLLPMLPTIPKPIAWGGLLMPVMWTAVSFVAMASMDSMPVKQLDWPSFIFAQFLFGIVVALIVERLRGFRPAIAGLIGGLIGGALMIIPAAIWAWATDHSIWYPANVLAGMVVPKIGAGTPADLQKFHSDWIGYAAAIHGTMSIVFGIVYGVLLPKLPKIPGPMSSGRAVDAGGLDGHQLQPDGCRQSGLAAARRLALVCRVAVYLRHRGLDRGRAVGTDCDSAGGIRPIATSDREGRNMRQRRDSARIEIDPGRVAAISRGSRPARPTPPVATPTQRLFDPTGIADLSRCDPAGVGQPRVVFSIPGVSAERPPPPATSWHPSRMQSWHAVNGSNRKRRRNKKPRNQPQQSPFEIPGLAESRAGVRTMNCRPANPPSPTPLPREARGDSLRCAFVAVTCLLLMGAVGCDSPGKPKPADRPMLPKDVTEFSRFVSRELLGLPWRGWSIRRSAAA